MKVMIREIRPEGIELRDEIAPDYIGLTKDDYIHFISPVKVTAQIQRVSNMVLVKIHAQGRFESSCYKTWKPVTREWSADFDLDFEIGKDTEFIELDEDIRQEVIMALPLRVLADGVKEDDALPIPKDVPIFLKNQKGFDKKQQETYKPFEKLKDIE